jgi:hypothetical protein
MFIFSIALIYNGYSDPWKTIKSLGLIFFVMVISLFIGGILLGIIQSTYFAIKSRNTEEERLNFLVERTPIYGVVLIIGAVMFFKAMGWIMMISFVTWFGLAFVSPWHREVRAIVEEWKKKE